MAGSFLTAFLGVAAVSLPVFAYFAFNGALRDCWLAYFYNNIFVYSTEGFSKTGIFKTLWKLLFNIGKAFVTNPQVLIFAPLGMIWDRRSPENAYMLSCFLFTAFFVYIGGRAYPYYAFILTVFSIYGFAMLPDVLKRCAKSAKNAVYPHSVKKRRLFPILQKQSGGSGCAVGFFLVFCTAFALLATPNRYLMSYKKEELPQYKFAEK